MREFLLKHGYFPAHADNRMGHEGDVALARECFLRDRPSKFELPAVHQILLDE
jgi:hypothetical protein